VEVAYYERMLMPKLLLLKLIPATVLKELCYVATPGGFAEQFDV
jgi:hypothetical protein